MSACLLAWSCTLDRGGASRVGADGEVPTRDAGAGRRDSGPCVPTTCEAEGAECGPITDGCGGTIECGMCRPDLVCGAMGMPNRCGVGPCTPRTCMAGDCGEIPDGCAGVITCPMCMDPDTCGGGGTANRCGCTPTSCAALGATCGGPADGCGGTLDCGGCTSPATCSATFTCECVPTTCGTLGATCGAPDDGCGTPLSCGTCESTTECGGSFTCVACTPDSAEPNDAPVDAHSLGDVSDSPDVADSFDTFTMHAARQPDYFFFRVEEASSDGDTESRIRLELRDVAPGQDADLRVTILCGGTGGTRSCDSGDSITQGCESVGSGSDETVDMRVDCDDGDVDVTVRVLLVGGGFTSCAPYTLRRTVQ